MNPWWHMSARQALFIAAIVAVTWWRFGVPDWPFEMTARLAASVAGFYGGTYLYHRRKRRRAGWRG